MTRSKRGSVEIQFNWIFVLIVGAVLLLFFYSVVKVQQKASDKSIGYTTAVDLNTIFTSAIESTGTLNIIKIPETTIDFTCYEYYINNVNKPFDAKSVFAPDRLQGKRLMTWAVDWHAPFKVTNFLFITNPEVRYVVLDPIYLSDPLPRASPDGHHDMFVELWDMLPEELNIETAFDDKSPDDIFVGDENDYKTRIVYFRDSTYDDVLALSNPPALPTPLKDRPDQSVTAIVIAGDDLDGSGMIYYFEKNGANFNYEDEFPYIRHETVLAAMFAEDADVYECGIRKAFDRMEMITAVYQHRTNNISDMYNDLGHRCTSFFTSTYVDAIAADVTDMIDSNHFDKTYFETLQHDINLLERTNRDTIAQSCARIY